MPAVENFYLTTTLPYVNAAPHLGFAWEILTADVIVRYQRLLGKDCIFNTGTDEHGQKIWQQATAAGLTPQEYTDQMVAPFKDLKDLLNLSYTRFIRTTDPAHVAAAQEFWRRCQRRGDIYRRQYTTKYCVGCELEKTDSELVDGCCPLHPHQPLELRQEDNYFFRFSRYQQPLLELYRRQPDFVLGQGKMTELVSFVERGLQDFSISRVRDKMPWGVPVPDDDKQVMYVWFDALVSYISTLGWPDAGNDFDQFWPGVQICGKDNLRQQGAMWQAMLMSAGLPNSSQILVNGFISVDGQKMSKSLGNVISPADLVATYGPEPTRFLIASLPVLAGDVDLTAARLHDFYTAHLTNGLGNLASRLAKLASSYPEGWELMAPAGLSAPVQAAMQQFQTSEALAAIIAHVQALDGRLSADKPWLIKDNPKQFRAVLQPCLEELLQIAYDLRLFMPQTSQTILGHFHPRHIMPLPPLFPRLKGPTGATRATV